MRQYFEVDKTELWTAGDYSATFDCSTGKWEPSKPEVGAMSVQDWFIHSILRRHFSWGQPYCTVCGYGRVITNNN